jgi:hypothetical protein
MSAARANAIAWGGLVLGLVLLVLTHGVALVLPLAGAFMIPFNSHGHRLAGEMTRVYWRMRRGPRDVFILAGCLFWLLF